MTQTFNNKVHECAPLEDSNPNPNSVMNAWNLQPWQKFKLRGACQGSGKGTESPLPKKTRRSNWN